MCRNIIEPYDSVSFKSEFFESKYFQKVKHKFKWIPKKGEAFIVKKTYKRVFRNRLNGDIELHVGVYSKKGTWTSHTIPARFIERIFQRNGKDSKVFRNIYISSVFNADLFKNYKWELWDKMIKNI